MITKKTTTNIMERELVGKILSGDEQALRSYYTAYKNRIFTFINSKIANREDAEEVFSDTFIASIEALRDFTFRSQLLTFLYGIAKRKVVDYYRRRRIEDVLFSRLGNAASLVSRLLTPEQEYSRTEAREVIEGVLRSLTPRYERILRFKYIEGFSVKEIARKLSETVKQSEATLFRARREFATVYTQWENKNDYHLKKQPIRSYNRRWLNKLKFQHRI